MSSAFFMFRFAKQGVERLPCLEILSLLNPLAETPSFGPTDEEPEVTLYISNDVLEDQEVVLSQQQLSCAAPNTTSALRARDHGIRRRLERSTTRPVPPVRVGFCSWPVDPRITENEHSRQLPKGLSLARQLVLDDVWVVTFF